MRREGRLNYNWIVDTTRTVRKWASYDGVADFLSRQADGYNKDLWSKQNVRVQIWIEKDALSGIVGPTVDEYDVPLVVARG